MKSILTFIATITLVVVLGLLIAFPVMWLWNYVMPDIFGLPTIVFWQAFALHALCSLLMKDTGAKITKD